MPEAHGSAQSCTANWVDLDGSVLAVRSSGIWSYIIKCTLAQSQFRILASNDRNFSLSVVDDGPTTLATDQVTGVGGPAFYRWYKIQIKEVTAGGKIEAYGHSA